MIIASEDLGVSIDLGKDKPGMTLQRQDKAGWHGYMVDGEVVKSPVDIDELPAGRYRLSALNNQVLNKFDQ